MSGGLPRTGDTKIALVLGVIFSTSLTKSKLRVSNSMSMNTGFRLSEPVFARLDDCVLEHEIPHLWIRKNILSDRKTKSSIRAVPLYGISLVAAKELYMLSKKA
jgi:hypothetical protein